MKRLVAFLLLVLAICVAERPARACGGFATRNAEPPFLAGERVLMLWDAETEQEDFIRETRFERARSTFGFVVPTPSKPTVFPVKNAPFDRLQKDFTYNQVSYGHGLLVGAGGGAPARAVEVLSEQRIGSFTAFTLAATDATALDKWLADNGLEMTPEAKPWVAHYVKLGFFFVAFRYEGGDAGDGLTSETVRIRFKTPHPYYPYLEPKRATSPGRRRLDVWLVSRDFMSPVSGHAAWEKRGLGRWTTYALQHGRSFKSEREKVAGALGAELAALLPAAPMLNVQPFRDEKSSREDFGDILFVPASPVTFTPEQEKAREHLLPLLDPTLIGEEPPPPAASAAPPPPSAPAPAPAPSAAPPSRSSSCSFAAGSGFGAGAAFVAVALLLLLRRRSRGVAFVLVAACDRTTPAATDAAPSASVVSAPPSASAAPPVPPLPRRDEAARKKAALAVLAGEKPFAPGLGMGEPAFFPPFGEDGIKDERFPWAEVWVGASSLPGEQGAHFVATVTEARKALGACYLAGLHASPALEGDVALLINGNGDAGPPSVNIEASPMPTAVNTCITQALRTLTFDKPAAPVKIRLTFSRQR